MKKNFAACTASMLGQTWRILGTEITKYTWSAARYPFSKIPKRCYTVLHTPPYYPGFTVLSLCCNGFPASFTLLQWFSCFFTLSQWFSCFFHSVAMVFLLLSLCRNGFHASFTLSQWFFLLLTVHYSIFKHKQMSHTIVCNAFCLYWSTSWMRSLTIEFFTDKENMIIMLLTTFYKKYKPINYKFIDLLWQKKLRKFLFNFVN